MGTLSKVRKVNLDDVPRIDLPGGSWSKMVLNNQSVEGNQSSLGYSIFKPQSETAPVSHSVEELAIVLSGHGELRLDDQTVTYGPGDALHIPAGVWHAVANTGDEDVVMVFIFPHPDYPPTERR